MKLEGEDQIQLIRGSCVELLCLRAALTRYNPTLNCLQLIGGQHICKTQTKGDIDGKNGFSALFEELLEFALQLYKLHLDKAEIALFAALIVITRANIGKLPYHIFVIRI